MAEQMSNQFGDLISKVTCRTDPCSASRKSQLHSRVCAIDNEFILVQVPEFDVRRCPDPGLQDLIPIRLLRLSFAMDCQFAAMASSIHPDNLPS